MIPEHWQRRGQFYVNPQLGHTAHRVTFDDEGVTLWLPSGRFQEGDRVRFWSTGEHYPHIFVPEGTLGTVEGVDEGGPNGRTIDVYPDGFPREHEYQGRMVADEWNGCYVHMDAEDDFVTPPFEHESATPSSVSRRWEDIVPWVPVVPVHVRGLHFKKGDERYAISENVALAKARNFFALWGNVCEALFYHVCHFEQYTPREDKPVMMQYVCISADSERGLFDTLLVINPLRDYSRRDFVKDAWKDDLKTLTDEQRSEVNVALDYWMERGRNRLQSR